MISKLKDELKTYVAMSTKLKKEIVDIKSDVIDYKRQMDVLRNKGQSAA